MKRYRSTRLSTDARIRAAKALAAQREEQLNAEEIAYMMAMHAPEDDQMLVDPDAADTDILQDENDNADEDVREDLDDLQGPDAEDLEEMEEEMAEDAIETVEMEAESDADEELVITEE